jgi:glycosyltransferase involved in cell wall biosynthesis
MKKQIVFVESFPTVYSFKFARELKLTKEYETVLISFSKVNENFYKKAYDKIIVFEISHKISFSNMFSLVKILFNSKKKNFIKEINNLDPYLFQVTGPDLFTYLFMKKIKKKPKIYFAYDIWNFYKKKRSLKNLEIKEAFQKYFEKKCFRLANGVLHKGPSGELNLLDYSIKKPDLALIPGCLKEWTFSPKKKKSKEIHLVHAGGPQRDIPGIFPFIEITKQITKQKIHLHVYGPCSNDIEKERFLEESKKNSYFHWHEKKDVKELNKDMSNYNYGIIFNFYDFSIMNQLFPKTSMANKMFNYIEAGIPILIDENSKVMSDIIQKEKIGLIIPFNRFESLREILEKQDYNKLQENIKRCQEKFSVSHLTKELENFYEKVVSSSKHN